MLQAGVPVPEAMAAATEAPTTVSTSGAGRRPRRDVRGEGMSRPIAETGLFPAAAQMLRVGEDSGTLDRQLEPPPTYYEGELDYKLSGSPRCSSPRSSWSWA